VSGDTSPRVAFLSRSASWRAGYGFTCAGITVAVLALIAHVSKQPFIFPSLGPSAFLAFTSPNVPSASPRSTVFGHWIGALGGYAALWMFGLAHHPGALVEGVSWQRIGAAALAVGLTTAGMVLANTPHPPACATALIVSLGLLRKPQQIAVVFAAVVVIAAVSVVINRAARVNYPIWRS
jgi:CBS domain-containing membrane protein